MPKPKFPELPRVEKGPKKGYYDFQTRYKTWNTKANGDHGYLGPGNVISAIQFGWLIRSWWDKGEGCGDYPQHVRAPGELFKYDLRPFKPDLPYHIEHKIERVAKRPENPKGVWLHEIHHKNQDHIKIVHGYVLTDHDHYLIQWWLTNRANEQKSLSVMEECVKYLALPTKKYEKWLCPHCGAWSPKTFVRCKNCLKEE